jgi:hypothetical protein
MRSHASGAHVCAAPYPGTGIRAKAASELANAVIFTSDITHYGEPPPGMAREPEFLRWLPDILDDVHFLPGIPRNTWL